MMREQEGEEDILIAAEEGGVYAADVAEGDQMQDDEEQVEMQQQD